LGKQNHDAVAQAEAKLRAAEKIVGDLEEKSQRLARRGKEIGDRIAALGFKVHAENDAAARAELDKLSGEAVAHQAEMRSLGAAINQAANNVEAVRGVVAREVRRVAIKEQQKLVKQFKELGPFLDKATQNLRKGLIALKENSPVVGRDFRHVQTLSRCLQVALFDTPFRDAFGVPDHPTRQSFSNFSGVLNGWCDSCDSNLARELEALDVTPQKNEAA
jgi:hypothetical protein